VAGPGDVPGVLGDRKKLVHDSEEQLGAWTARYMGSVVRLLWIVGLRQVDDWAALCRRRVDTDGSVVNYDITHQHGGGVGRAQRGNQLLQRYRHVLGGVEKTEQQGCEVVLAGANSILLALVADGSPKQGGGGPPRCKMEPSGVVAPSGEDRSRRRVSGLGEFGHRTQQLVVRNGWYAPQQPPQAVRRTGLSQHCGDRSSEIGASIRDSPIGLDEQVGDLGARISTPFDGGLRQREDTTDGGRWDSGTERSERLHRIQLRIWVRPGRPPQTVSERQQIVGELR
jgi:hypothetical protein